MTRKAMFVGFKHLLFSPLPGKMIQFDLICFNWAETSNYRTCFNYDYNLGFVELVFRFTFLPRYLEGKLT